MQFRNRFRGAWIAMAAALADRLSKVAVARLGWAGPLIPGVVNLQPVQNRGMAFSLLSGQALLLSAVTALLIAGVAGWLMARPGAPRLMRAGLWLIVGGGLGNLYDRLTLGSVCDFIELAFVRFAVFNVADVCICLGAALAVIAGSGEEGVGNRE